MKAEEIIRYESDNVNTILLHINKSVCRVYEVSAYWLTHHTLIDKFHQKYCRCYNTHLLYVWFHLSKLDKVIEDLNACGFRPIEMEDNHIILQNETKHADNYLHWKWRIIKQLEFALTANSE